MARVFVIQNQPHFDFTDLDRFGRRIDIFPPGVQIYGDSGMYVDMARTRMRDITPEDYIVLTGDPVMIGLAFATADRLTEGQFKVLKWDGRRQRYVPITVDMEVQPI